MLRGEDELGPDLRHYCVSISADLVQAPGYPFNQRGCSGLNTTPTILAFNGFCVFPWLSALPHRFARGEAHPFSNSTVLVVKRLLPA